MEAYTAFQNIHIHWANLKKNTLPTIQCLLIIKVSSYWQNCSFLVHTYTSFKNLYWPITIAFQCYTFLMETRSTAKIQYVGEHIPCWFPIVVYCFIVFEAFVHCNISSLPACRDAPCHKLFTNLLSVQTTTKCSFPKLRLMSVTLLSLVDNT